MSVVVGRMGGWLSVALASILALGSFSVGGASDRSWRDVSEATGSGAVPVRAQHALAADPAGTIYIFGGAGVDGSYLGDLWRLPVGGRWEQVAPQGAPPPPMIEPHLVADADGDLYEFGGRIDAATLSNGLYRFDAGSAQWSDLSASARRAGVPPREDFGWTLDPTRSQIYLFGGYGPPGLMNDFWRYDIASDRWTDLTTESGASNIPPRELYNITSDGHDHVYLFGGVGYHPLTSAPTRFNDFWRYDIADGLWHDLTAATGSTRVPSRHYYGQAADDRGNFYVLGGWVTGPGEPPGAYIIGDFWKFDAAHATWIPAESSLTAGVLPRIPYNMAYRAPTDELLIFGGADGRQLTNETWTLQVAGAIPTPTTEPRPTERAQQVPTAVVTPDPPTPTPTPVHAPDERTEPGEARRVLLGQVFR
jgi:hypothetical protein